MSPESQELIWALGAESGLPLWWEPWTPGPSEPPFDAASPPHPRAGWHLCAVGAGLCPSLLPSWRRCPLL